MRTAARNLPRILLLAGLTLLPLRAGTNILFYPFARAFGSPPESELVNCRKAFTRLQTQLGTSRILIQPVLFVGSPRATWRDRPARELRRGLKEGGIQARFEIAGAAPEVHRPQLGHNQLRYLWQRSRDYSEWVRSAKPPGDYILFAEVFAHDGKVGAIHVFILDSSGQVAYCRLFNSHQFGPDLLADDGAPEHWIVSHLLKDLQRESTELFPPYGIG